LPPFAQPDIIPSRRTLLSTTAATLTIGAAGCLDGGDETADEPSDDETADEELAAEDEPIEEQESPADDSSDGTEDTHSEDETAGVEPPDADPVADEPLEATLQTSEGDVEVELYAERTPQTVANFVGLATGDQPWIDPETEEVIEGEPLYDDVLFHRIIDDFMIQGGDPTGTGLGGPGYEFADEFHEDLRHDDEGVLSMANAGPDTNGSQFFITLEAQPTLDDGHTVFGKVTDGMDVVRDIGNADTDTNDRPTEEVLLESVTVHE